MDEYPEYDFYNSMGKCDGKEGEEGRETRDGRIFPREKKKLNETGMKRRAGNAGPPPAVRKPPVDPSAICMLSGVNLH